MTRKAPTFLISALAGTTLALFTASPARAAPEDLSDGEKAKIRSMLTLMIKMQCETSAPLETIEDCLDQGGENAAEYDELPSSAGGTFKPTVKYAISQYFSMLRGTNRLQKDGRSAGGSTDWAGGGIDGDKVIISGKLLEKWCDTANNVDPCDQAAAKFWIMATLANEAAHVFQVPMALDTVPNDRKRCDAERDSDAMTLKFLNEVVARMTDGAGAAHDSLADIRAEGEAGKLLAKCLEDMGVDTAQEIADTLKKLKDRRDTYQDRKENLFENSIAGNRSWRQLYYGRQYRSPLKLRKDLSNLVTRREVVVTYGSNSRTITIPNDGKIPISVAATVDNQSRLVLIVVTLNPLTGEMCIHTWTDTDRDGLPGGAPNSVTIPAPPSGPRDVPEAPGDIAHVEGVADGLGFAHGYMLHDRLNGALTAIETDEDWNPTGRAVEMFRDPLIASIEVNPDAGNYFELETDRTMPNGTIEVVFESLPHAGSTGACEAALGIFDPDLGFGEVFAGLTSAEALAPHNLLGISQLPVDPTRPIVAYGNPGEQIVVESVGLGFPQVLFQGVAGPEGATNPGEMLFPGSRYDLVRVRSNERLDQAEHFWSLVGLAQDEIDVDLNNDGVPDVLALTSEPSRLVTFMDDPRDPGVRQLGLEIVVEDPHAIAFDLPQPGVVTLESLDSSVELSVAIADDFWNQLLAQTLIDLDGDGIADDTFIVARDPFSQDFAAISVVDAGFDAATITSIHPLPGLDPRGIEYADLDGDGDLDVIIRGADFDGCFENVGDGTMQPGPCDNGCPADLDGDGDADSDDFFRYLDLFASGDALADLDGDGDTDSDDFFRYLDLFVQGC